MDFRDIRSRVGSSVGSSVWDSVRDSVRDSVWSSVWSSVRDNSAFVDTDVILEVLREKGENIQTCQS